MFAGVKGFFKSAIANAVDAYFNRTTLLLHGDGTNGAQNNTFIDSSSNNFTITRNGNTTQGTFSPFSQTGWSNYFNGSTDYFQIPYNAAFAPTSGNFTAECWVYFTAVGGLDQIFVGNINGSSGNGDWAILWRGGASRFEFMASSSGALAGVQRSYNTTSPVVGQWYHVVGVKNGSTLSCYVNGVKGTDATLATISNSSLNLTVGCGSGATAYTIGYLSNARIVNGSAVYSGASFTPPTSPLTAITNTALLTCQSNRFIDNSSNAFTLTASGTPSVQAFSPFAPTAAYSAATVGGSGYFDGSGDYLTLPNINFGSNDFCAECWFYRTGNDPTSWSGLFAKGTGDTTEDFRLQVKNDTVYFDWGSTGAYSLISATVISQQWNHIAVARSSGTVKIFLNGTQIGSNISLATISNNYTTWTIGSNFAGNTFTGYIAGLRFVNGSPVYTANFTPPTAPPTAITNTQLLLNFTNGGIFDQTGKNDLETVGNAQISTSVKKYGSGSIYLDGTGDWLALPMTNVLSIPASSQFTFECWIYLSAAQANYRMLVSDTGSAATYVAVTSSGVEVQFGSTAPSAASCSYSFSTSTWYHIAVVRNSSNAVTVYINGVAQTMTNGTQSGAFLYQGSTFYVGRWGGATSYEWNGYIDDLRITKGYARYTANFTPPTAAFPDQ